MIPPLPTRMREVAAATGPIITSGLLQARPGRPVMLGQPIAVVAQSIRQPRKFQRVAQRIARGRTGRDRRLIQNIQFERHWLEFQRG